MPRQPSNADLRATIQGLQMQGMSLQQLALLQREYERQPDFTAVVIARAASQVAALKLVVARRGG